MKLARTRTVPSLPADDALALLRELLAEIRGLRADLAAPRAPAGRSDEALLELVRCLAGTVGDRQFSAWELVEFARLPSAVGLREAIAAAGAAENCRRVGKLLKAAEGLEIAGFRVVRVGQDREGAIWQLASLRV